MDAPTFTAMQHAPHEYVTLAEAAGWARVTPGVVEEAVLLGDLRSVAGSLVRVRDLDRWARAVRAARCSRSVRQLRDHTVQFLTDSQKAV